MWPRLRRSNFQKQKGPGNKKAMKRLVQSGPPPGLLAYDDGRPVAWCALAPRETYHALANSRILKPVDDQPVWSVVCFFVAKPYRRRGLSTMLLDEAGRSTPAKEERAIEGYPVEPKTEARSPDVFLWTGLASAFRKAGFEEAARRS